MNYLIKPAIIEPTEQSLREKIELCRQLNGTCHIDCSDGIFTPNILFNTPEKLSDDLKKIDATIHLMVAEPHAYWKPWSDAGARTIIFHLESYFSLPKKQREFAINNLINTIHGAGKTVGIALLYETSIVHLAPFVKKIDLALMLSIKKIGYQGEPFQDGVFEKISTAKKLYPELILGIDGGISEKNIKKLVEAGATELSVGSFLWNGEPEINYRKLTTVIS